MKRGTWLTVLVCAFSLPAAPARAVDEAEVKQAMDRGVAYLKSLQQADGTWVHPASHEPGRAAGQSGCTALVGLTLLECGVPTDDPAIQKAAAFVRHASIAETATYSLALNILFLDRLGEDIDVALIQSMAVRLLAGQATDGAWHYSCPGQGEEEYRRLSTKLQGHSEFRSRSEVPKPQPGEKRSTEPLPQQIRNQLARIPAGGARAGDLRHTDHSNTQFAILGLWVARRHGIPADRALARVAEHFRATQNPDGGWGYWFGALPGGARRMAMHGSTPSMTCAGLLGLAAAYAASTSSLRAGSAGKEPAGRAESEDKALASIAKDLHVRKGLKALGSSLAVSPVESMPGPEFAPPNRRGQPFPAAGEPPADAQSERRARSPMGRGESAAPFPFKIGPGRAGKAYYFLWSLERVGVAYGLEKIGGKDWYTWGAAILLANQEADGSWRGAYAQGGPDTCFALLFLRRANLAKDLNASLQGKVKNPSTVELRGSGVDLKGIENLKPLKPAIDPNETSDEAAPPPEPPTAKLPTTAPPVPREHASAARLSAELVEAPPNRQDSVLQKLCDGKGSEYSQALALAIAQLSGEVKKKAREGLAERLSRLKIDNVLTYLDDENMELRRAAAIACALKEANGAAGKLIELLEDRELPVQRAAYAALKSLSGQDFGPAAKVSSDDKAKAVAAWRAWWKQHPGK
jgi:hypothetical protein